MKMNYKKFLEKSIIPNAIIDLNGTILFYNNALKKIIGRDKSDITDEH